MADITEQIYTLNVQPGIKRDGTVFEAREFSDGVWCRFQRGIPKKMGGYSTAFNTFNGISRGLSMGSVNGVNYVFSGNANGIDVFETNQYIGFGAGPFPALFNIGYAPFTITSQTTSSITIASATNYTGIFLPGTPTVFTQTPTSTLYYVTSSTYNPISTQTATITIASPAVITYSSGIAPANGTKVVFSTTGALPTGITAGTTYYVVGASGANSNIAATAGGTAINTSGTQSGVHTVSIGATTVVSYSVTLPTSLTMVYLANYVFTPNQDDPRLLWQFEYQYSPQGAALKVLAHPGNNLFDIDNGVPTQVYIADLVPNSSNQWVFTGLADTSGTSPTNLPIAVSGGVCILHPFIFVYGSNGFIANNNVSSIYAERNLSDWNGPLANQVNMASGKIVFGMPMRGGTGSPSGLFWATDSLIRVSFTGNSANYWQYDIIASDVSIMSSRSVVEMDGVFYWLGVDRFYLYNGVVQVLPNDKNLNWLLDNINFDERQKVWATKVPKYNEIWFFYPRGQETECTDAIIYNVKDKIWYDAGQAEGARRSSGFTTQIFRSPVWAGWDFNISYSQPFNLIATPSGQTAPTSTQFYLVGNQSGRFAPGSYLKFSKDDAANIYQVATAQFIFSTTPNVNATKVTVTQAITDAKTVPTSNTVTISIANPAVITYPSGGLPANGTAIVFSTTGSLPTSIIPGNTYYVINGSGTTSNISTSITGTAISTLGQTQSGTQTISTIGSAVFGVQGGYSIWQHENGLNKITVNDEAAIYSSFTTCDLSWVGGTPSEDASPGINRRMHLRRLEPDFVQSGDIYMTVLGRKFARGYTENSPTFTITPDTEKVDLRLEYRELRLLFESNEVGGNYELGRTMITADLGDERP
jgi:hypothetical protein